MATKITVKGLRGDWSMVGNNLGRYSANLVFVRRLKSRRGDLKIDNWYDDDAHAS